MSSGAIPQRRRWRMFPAASLALLALLLGAGCAPKRVRDAPPPVADATRPAAPADTGGLYAPHIQDGAPTDVPDIDTLPEPVPRVEPRARYGNHSPYTVLGRQYHVMDDAHGYVERGVASWYGTKFHGRATSSFEPYDMFRFTAAHKTLPLPSYVRVTNLENDRSLVVRVNDRGPFAHDRLIDLSYAAAVRLGVHPKGTARVEVRAIDPREHTVLADATDAPVSGVPTQPATVDEGAAGGADAPRPAWLQIGSFADRANAERLASRLRGSVTQPVRVDSAQVGTQPMYRVRFGPFREAAEALALSELLGTLGFGTSSVFTE